jgi:hypothetical protein
MKTVREIIARAYDREQAAQMGEPDPWQDGTDHPEWEGSLGCADVAITALAAEGFSIVETGRDPVTIDACAKLADAHAINAWEIAQGEGQNDVCASGRNHGARAVATAIRDLSRSTREGKT